jgi:hypothetical protein
MNSMTPPPGSPAFPRDLSVLSTDQLLALSNQCFEQLDCEHPTRDAFVQYYALTAELEIRDEDLEDGDNRSRLGA